MINAQYVYALQDGTNPEDLDAYEDLLKEQQAIGGEVFRIPVERLPQLEAKLDKLNKKATKLSTPPIVLADTGERDVEEAKVGRTLRKQEWAYVTVSGRTPMLNGWAFMATVEHTDHGNVIHPVPAFARPQNMPSTDFTPFRSTGQLCEHCKINRYRIDTYLVQNEDTGEVKQVGSSCLADFTGINNPNQVAKWFESLFAWRKFLHGGYSGEQYMIPDYDLWGFMATASAVVRNYGYVSYKKAEETGKAATSRIVKSIYFDLIDQMYSTLVVEQEDYDNATKVIDWVRNDLTPRANGDYEQNLATIFASNRLTDRMMGYAASAVTVYWRETAPKIAKVNHTDAFVGTVGQKQTFVVDCQYVGQWFESQSGYMTRKVQFTDAEGHKLVWWSTSKTEFEVGKRYTFTAKIKNHKDDSKFGKETSIGNARNVMETQAALV